MTKTPKDTKHYHDSLVHLHGDCEECGDKFSRVTCDQEDCPIEVEWDEETWEGPCECCGKKLRIVGGDLWDGSDLRGMYIIRDRPEDGCFEITVASGDFTDEAEEEIKAVQMIFRPKEDGSGYHGDVLDPDFSSEGPFRALTREEAIKDPDMPSFNHLAMHVIAEDYLARSGLATVTGPAQ